MRTWFYTRYIQSSSLPNFLWQPPKESWQRKVSAVENLLKTVKHTKKSGASVFGLCCENLSLIRTFLNVCFCFFKLKFPKAVWEKVNSKQFALGFEAGYPLGEDSVKSQTEK